MQRLLGTSFAENAGLRRKIDRIQASLDARELVDHAVGIIMGRLDIDVEDAKAVLSAGAGAHDDKLRLVAAAVVAARRIPSELIAAVLIEEPAGPAPLEF